MFADYELTVKTLEKERETIKNQFYIREHALLDKIRLLESRLTDETREDMMSLQQQNHVSVEKLKELNKSYNSLISKHESEKKKFNSIVIEVKDLKTQLVEELKSLEDLKMEILSHQSSDKPQTEIVMNQEIKKEEPKTLPDINQKKPKNKNNSESNFEPVITGNKITIKVRNNI